MILAFSKLEIPHYFIWLSLVDESGFSNNMNMLGALAILHTG